MEIEQPPGKKSLPGLGAGCLGVYNTDRKTGVPPWGGKAVRMKKILVTGAGGFVGARAMQQLADRYEMAALPRGMASTADRKEITEFVQGAAPDMILHTAAVSDTGYSEAHPEESRRANVDLTLWMAEAAREAGAKLVCFSSDQVYLGLPGEGPFAEEDVRTPANVYGRHKLEAEQRVLDLLPDAVMLRATWMYDLPGYGLPIRSNLPLNLLRAALTGESVVFSSNEYRGVTYVRQVIENLIPAMELPGGCYNFGSENPLDMYATARAFCAALGIDPPLVQGDRVRSLAMDCGKIRRAGILFDDTAQGIRRCLADYGLNNF